MTCSTAIGYEHHDDGEGYEVGGLTCDEFIEMMALHAEHVKDVAAGKDSNHGANMNLARLFHDNASRIGHVEFHNKRMAAIAERNSFKHQVRDTASERLDCFLSDTTESCARCHKHFKPEENGDAACHYHSENGKQEGAHTRKFMDEILFPCCGRVQKGTAPILSAADPCCVGRHMTKAEQATMDKHA